jgi:hypothetical protein
MSPAMAIDPPQGCDHDHAAASQSSRSGRAQDTGKFPRAGKTSDNRYRPDAFIYWGETNSPIWPSESESVKTYTTLSPAA